MFLLEDPHQVDADLDGVLHGADDEETATADEIKEAMAWMKLGKAKSRVHEARNAVTQAKHWGATAKKLQAAYEDSNYHPVRSSVGNLALRREWQLKAYNLYETALRNLRDLLQR